MRRFAGFATIFVFFLSVFSGVFPAYPLNDSPACAVTDLSDREYEEKVISLIDNAKDSIVISMYEISPGPEGSPVRLLLKDLLEARERGVSITMYLNTRFREGGIGEDSFINSPVFKELKDAGCRVYLVPPGRRLHDKLIIVDSRYVIVGSTNWSNSALRRNFETNTLIDSPRHAREKLEHLKKVLDFIKSNSPISGKARYIEELPERLSIPEELMLDKRYLSRMVTKQDRRAFNLYLLLLAHSQLTGEKKFFINLEDMGLSLGLPHSWTFTALRRQAIRTLKKLQKDYNLITVRFIHGKDASVALLDIPGASFAVSPGSLIREEGPELTLRLKFLLLIDALLKSEGKGLYSVAKSDLAKRFNLDKSTIHEAFKDLEELKRDAVP